MLLSSRTTCRISTSPQIQGGILSERHNSVRDLNLRLETALLLLDLLLGVEKVTCKSSNSAQCGSKTNKYAASTTQIPEG